MRARFLIVGIGLVLTNLVCSAADADVINLQQGGALRGRVTKSDKAVTVTTTTGTRIAVPRSNVKTIQRESSTSRRKSRLTEAEKAWVGKIRRLTNGLNGDDRAAAGRAMRELRAVNDPDAIPALSLILRLSDVESHRLLYVRILQDLPGSKGIVALVEEALFDSSPVVREAAQAASKKVRAQNIRPYYGQALRFPNHDVVGRAARVLAVIGDKENVPALIDALSSPTLDVTMRPTCCMSRTAFLARDRFGNFSLSYSMNAERLEGVPVVRNVENPPVREALEAITQRSFGYNKEAWRRWWKSTQLADAQGATVVGNPSR